MALDIGSSYTFNPNEFLTLAIAAYGAVISTFVLGWDAYKWLAAGPKVEVRVSTGMKVVGGALPDENTYISVTAFNVGDQPTTITNLGGMHFNSWWSAYISRRNPTKAFIISEPSQAQRIPFRFEVGDQWAGLVIQTEDLVNGAKNGYLFLILYTAKNGRGHRARVRIHE
jgi:hypothetical protein